MNFICIMLPLGEERTRMGKEANASLPEDVAINDVKRITAAIDWTSGASRASSQALTKLILKQ